MSTIKHTLTWPKVVDQRERGDDNVYVKWSPIVDGATHMPTKDTLNESKTQAAETVPPEEVAKRLLGRGSARTGQRAIDRGDIPSVQMGRRKIVLRAPFERFMRGELNEFSPRERK
jgi:hypothetical protein